MSDNDREPVAWLAFATYGRDDLAEVYISAADAEKAAVAWGGRVTPLFFTPTLTDAERTAVALMADVAADPRGVAVYAGYQAASTLRGLLERTEPVEK